MGAETYFWKQYVPEIDLAEDAAWSPAFNPYQGRITPIWQITAEARMRLEHDPPKVIGETMTGDKAIAAAINAGCIAADIYLTCSYPTCICKKTPIIVRAALAEYWRVMGTRSPPRPPPGGP